MAAAARSREDRYKWVALANTTAGMFMAMPILTHDSQHARVASSRNAQGNRCEC